jgi:hypothetical protein
MARKSEFGRAKASEIEPFFDLLAQMEALLSTADLEWPENMRADARRRLNRLVRALRNGSKNREWG